MKSFKKLITGGLAAALITAMTLGFGGAASAACFQYSASGMVTSDTPVFNNICNVPEGIGNESDFVRIRQSNNGNDQDNQNNPNFTIGNLSAACNVGDKFDVWNYVHNDATQDLNNNGSGSAVAHNVMLAMSAKLNTPATSFPFTSTISASNATSVTDTATLNCSGNQVQLTVVPSSVHVYSSQYGWKDLADGAVNGSTKLGSPTFGSGDVWGCWNYRELVVYEVQVKEIPQQPQITATCDLFKVDAAEENNIRSVKVSNFKYTAKNTSITDATILWDATNTNGDKTTGLRADQVIGQTHQYGADGTYLVKLVLTFSGVNTPVANCEEQVTFNSQTPPTVTPPTTTVTRLVNTGPGSVAALFSGVTAASAVAYRWVLGRRLTDR